MLFRYWEKAVWSLLQVKKKNTRKVLQKISWVQPGVTLGDHCFWYVIGACPPYISMQKILRYQYHTRNEITFLNLFRSCSNPKMRYICAYIWKSAKKKCLFITLRKSTGEKAWVWRQHNNVGDTLSYCTGNKFSRSHVLWWVKGHRKLSQFSIFLQK